MRAPIGNLQGLISNNGVFGPWLCDRCGEVSQYADIRKKLNRIFCLNCGFRRTIDKVNCRIVEDDGTQWLYDQAGNKTQVRPV